MHLPKLPFNSHHRDTMPSHPKTYTAYAFTKAGGQLERITVDWKDPEAGSIVIKVLACGVCAGYVPSSVRSTLHNDN